MILPPIIHVLERLLRCNKHSAQVDVDHLVQLLHRCFLKYFREADARIVDQHIQPTQRSDRLIDGAPDRLGFCGVSLNGNSLPAARFYRLYYAGGSFCTFGIGDRHAGPVRGQPLCNSGANAARTTGNQCDLVA